jgi:hypothetical protein
MVGEEVGAALRLHLGLVLHVLTAAGEEKQARDCGEESCSPTHSQKTRMDGARNGLVTADGLQSEPRTTMHGPLIPDSCSLFPDFEVVHQYSTSTIEFGLNFSR